jgi:hypothetical protein
MITSPLISNLSYTLISMVSSKSTANNSVTYLNDVTPPVCSQEQFDSVYFDLSQDFDKVPHALLFNKLNQYGLSSSYVKLFQNYLLNRSSFVRILGKCSSPFSVLSGARQGSALGPLLFNIFCQRPLHYNQTFQIYLIC